MIVMMPCRICWTKIIQDPNETDNKELIKTIEALFEDPLKRRALYFNLKYKQVKSDLNIVLAQRDKLIKDNMVLSAQLTKQRKLRIVLVIGGFTLGVSIGIGLIVAGAKIGQLVSAWR
jgi:hypothetical protein